MNTDTNDTDNADGSNSTDNTTLAETVGVVRGALERLEDDDADIDEAATRVRHLKVAQEFDDAEATETQPEPLVGVAKKGGHQYGVEGDKPSEWLTTTYVVATGDAR